MRLKNRPSTLLIAICTYAMCWFSEGFLRLQLVSKGSTTKVGEFVPLLLGIPCFKLSHVSFKLAYSLQQRELVRLGRECARLGGQDFSLKFNNPPLNSGGGFEVHKAFRDIRRSLQAENG